MRRREFLENSGIGLLAAGVAGLAGCSSLTSGGGGNETSNHSGTVSGEIVEKPYDALEITVDEANVREVNVQGREFTAFAVSGTATNTGDERLTSTRPDHFAFEVVMRVFDSNDNRFAETDGGPDLTSLDPGEEAPWIITYEENPDQVARYEIEFI